jgi:cytochrome c
MRTRAGSWRCFTESLFICTSSPWQRCIFEAITLTKAPQLAGEINLVRTFTLPVALFIFVRFASAADAVAGKAYFTQVCTQCHSAERTDGGGETGPTLFELFGRPAAVGDEAFPYSQALKDSKLVWDAATLERFLADPMTAVPGTTMPMPIAVKTDRDNVVAYFASLMKGAK